MLGVQIAIGQFQIVFFLSFQFLTVRTAGEFLPWLRLTMVRILHFTTLR